MFRKLQLFRPTNDERRGQALVEFSLTVLVFIVLLLMIIELARIMYAYVNLQHSARMAARYAVTGQWMTEYSTDPKAHYQLTPPYSPHERIPPCWPLFNDDTVAPITPSTEPVEQSFQPYRDARTCSIEHIALNNMVGLNLDPTALRAESGYYRVMVSGVGKSVDPNAGWERYEYSGGAWTLVEYPSYQRTANGLNLYETPTTGYQLIAGYGGLPQQKVVVQIEYRLPIIAPILSSIAPNVRLTATAIMTNEAFGSTGLNREAVLPPELPDLPEFLDPTPTNLVPSGIVGLPGLTEQFQYGESYDLRVVVVNEGDTALIPENPVSVEIYYIVGGATPPDAPTDATNVGGPFIQFGGAASLQEAIPKDQPTEFPVINGSIPEQAPGELVHFYACVDTAQTVDETGAGLGLNIQANEEDNCKFIETHTADIYADLTITGVDYSPTGKNPSQLANMQIVVEVTNEGPSDATGAQVRVNWPAGLFASTPPTLVNLNPPTITPGGTGTATFLGQVGNNPGEFNVTFEAIANNQKDPDDPTIPGGVGDTWDDTIAVAGVDMSITQEFYIDTVQVPSDEVPVLNPGETMEVRLIVENLSTNSANDVTVTHAQPTNAGLNVSGVTIDPVSAGSYNDTTDIWTLAPNPFPGGASATLSYEITLAAGASGGIDWVSEATVNTTSPTYNQGDDSVSTDARVASSDISVTVNTSLGPNPTPREGEQFNILVTVTNNGEDPATDVQISAPIHADLIYITQAIQDNLGTYNQSTGLWEIDTLDVGSWTLSITVEPDVGSGVNPPFAFVAELTAAEQDDPDSTPNNGVTTEDDYDTITIDVGERVDLAVNSYEYTVNGDHNEDEAYITDLVVYTLEIANIQNSDLARDVEVDLAASLPFDQVFGDISVTASAGSFNATTGVWTVGDMVADTTETLEISARVKAGTTLGEYDFNTTATISSAEIDPIVYNNTRSADPLTIKPLFLNIGSRWSGNCNSPITWDGVEWLPADDYGTGGTTYGLEDAGNDYWTTNGNDYTSMVNPGSGNERRIVACRAISWENFSFRIDNVPEGQYILSLLFVDMDYSTAGQRDFDVTVSTGGTPTTILSDYDIAAAAGGRYRYVIEQTIVNITGSTVDLDIGLIQDYRAATLSGVGLEFDTSTIPTPTPTTPAPGDSTPPTNPTTLSSPSHTVGGSSTDNTIDVAWSADATDDDSGVAGYSVQWSNSASTVPDTIVDHVEGVFGETSSALADGDWYFHLRTCDNAGNCAAAMHLGPFTIAAGPPAGAFGPGYYEETEADITWAGSWSTYSGGGTSGGTLEQTSQVNATVSFTIYGDQLTLYSYTSWGYSSMEVCIDGSCQVISLSAAPEWQHPTVFSGLGAGTHTVVIRNTASGWINLDAFRVE